MKAIILLSGGIDSTVALAIALGQGRQCIGVTFDYSQRHKVELKAAQKVAQHYQIPQHLVSIDPQIFAESSLINTDPIVKNRSLEEMGMEGIPNTYVPARNTLFLAYAMGLAEKHNASEIYFGANSGDRYCYPDCRPEFMEAFQRVFDVATQDPIKLLTPLANMEKVEIIRLGLTLKAPLELTSSCYDPHTDGTACHQCDACILREQAFCSLDFSRACFRS